MSYAILRQSVYESYLPPEHVAMRHDIVGVRSTLSDLDVDADHFVGLVQMRVGERLVSAVSAAGYRYIIEREPSYYDSDDESRWRSNANLPQS